MSDAVQKMVNGIKGPATPLQDLILSEAVYDRDYANKAADELANYELRLDLLARGATWEHNRNSELEDELAELRDRVKKSEEMREVHGKNHYRRRRLKRVHTRSNRYFKGPCHYSPTGWAWWKNPEPGDVCQSPYCTCDSCKPPKLPFTDPDPTPIARDEKMAGG